MQRAQIVVDDPEELEVHEQLIQRCIAAPLPDPQRRRLQAVGAVLQRDNGVDQREPPVVMTVPVDLDVLSRLVRELSQELDEAAHAAGVL